MPTTRVIQEWEKLVIANLQAQENAIYADKLKQFKSAADSWIKSGVSSRANGQAVPPFNSPIPKQVVIEAGEAPGERIYTETIDPNIHLPELPPPTPTIPSVPLGTEAGTRDQAIFSMLGQIQVSLAAIMKAVGAK